MGQKGCSEWVNSGSVSCHPPSPTRGGAFPIRQLQGSSPSKTLNPPSLCSGTLVWEKESPICDLIQMMTSSLPANSKPEVSSVAKALDDVFFRLCINFTFEYRARMAHVKISTISTRVSNTKSSSLLSSSVSKLPFVTVLARA